MRELFMRSSRAALAAAAVCACASFACAAGPSVPQATATPAEFRMSDEQPAPPATAPSALPPAAVQPSSGPAQGYQAPSSTDTAKPQKKMEPVLLSGMVLMPTAYRSTGRNSIGLNLDINAAYYIGRLYGKNSYTWTTNKKNYLDRIGLWVLSADAKMTVQTEQDWRPALAAGALGMFTVRDSGQPKLDNPTVQVNVNSTDKLASAYVVASKKWTDKFIFTLGYMEGSVPDIMPQLSEYLTAAAMTLNGHDGQQCTSRSMAFGGIIWLPRPDRPITLEIMAPQGAPGSPKLFNLHLGSLLHMNFEVSYLNFDGGWDLLGMFQFRYNYFPRH